MKIALGIIIAVLVMLLAGLGWYTFTLMQENETHLATINSMNESDPQAPECTPLDASGIATTMTDPNDAGDAVYCVTASDLSVAYTTEQMAMEQSAELLVALDTSVEAVQACMTADKFINESVANMNVCDDMEESMQWPDVTTYGGQWGGCDFAIDKETQTFSYCAQANAGAVITCTQDGCKESSTMVTHEEDLAPMDEEIAMETGTVETGANPTPAPEELMNDPVEEETAPPLL